jgi:NhaA family Na+:H+ antiporter
MSIFITNLAFADQTAEINSSKIAILVGSLLAATLGFLWLKLFGKAFASDADVNTMDFHKEPRRKGGN